MADRVGEQLGDYRLTRLLGKGSFGEVYLGEQVYLQTQAAIKVLHTQMDPGELQNFLNEARRVATLNHPHIVRLHGFSVEKGTPFMVMQLAPRGTLLKRYPRKQRFPIETILPHVKQLAEGLQYAHDRKIIHLDIKPENMLLGEQDEVLLSDFGVAVVLQQTKSHVTVRGFSGTAIYAAPEQFFNQVGPASDQYALAVVVYEWLTGEWPYYANNPLAIGMAKAQQPPPSLRAKVPSIAPAVEQVMLKALASDPRNRYPTVRAFAEALEQASKPPVRPPVVTKPAAIKHQPRPAPVAAPPANGPGNSSKTPPATSKLGKFLDDSYPYVVPSVVLAILAALIYMAYFLITHHYLSL